jgi:hypothetical protein
MRGLLIFVIFLITSHLSGFSQKPKTLHSQLTKEDVIEKWIKSTVNLAFRTTLGDQPEQILKLAKWKRDNKIDLETYAKAVNSLENIGFIGNGSALYFKIGEKRGLLTARHVLHDCLSSDSNAICLKFFLSPNGSDLKETRSNNGQVIPDPRAMIMLPRHFRFSSINDDLGVIYFDGVSPFFINYLDSQGYKPISIDDIDTTWNYKIGDDIMAVGFPDFSVIQARGLTRPLQFWGSNDISLPVITYGKISDLQEGTISFSGNIYIYHGNSGGPIIRNNKLIGIVSGFHRIEFRAGQGALNKFFLQEMDFIKSSCIWNFLQGRPLLNKL